MEHVPYGILKGIFMKPAMNRLIPREETAQTEYIRDFIQWVYDGYTKETDLHMTRLMADIGNMEPVSQQDYQYLENRVFLILPQKDKAFTEQMQQDLVSLLPLAKVETIPGGHLATLMQAEEFAERTDAFLKEVTL